MNAEQKKVVAQTKNVKNVTELNGFVFIETEPPEFIRAIVLQPGQQQCPRCNKIYIPVLTRLHPEMKIQDEFPDAPVWQREQHLSAICSEKCWKEFVGIGGGEEYD